MHAHYLAFKALLLAVAVLAGKLHDTVRFTTGGELVRDNYVVLFPDGPDSLGDNRYTAPQLVDSKSKWRYDVRIVATTADGLMKLADAALSIIGQTPVVEGRQPSRVRLVPGVEEGQAKFDKTARLHFLDLSFEFDSRRAA